MKYLATNNEVATIMFKNSLLKNTNDLSSKIYLNPLLDFHEQPYS